MNQCWLVIFLNQIWYCLVCTMGMETAAVKCSSSYSLGWPSSVSYWSLLGQPVFPSPLLSAAVGCPQTISYPPPVVREGHPSARKGELDEQKAPRFLAPRSSDDFLSSSPPFSQMSALTPALLGHGRFEQGLTSVSFEAFVITAFTGQVRTVLSRELLAQLWR